jgi:choline dehydrogenase-like flavoprotein
MVNLADAVTRGETLRDDITLDVDAVVIGTGAGGSIALRELARAGLHAVALEEGGFRTSKDFNQREEQMLPMLFQDSGGRTTTDLAIRILQGRGVGGSTVHNTNLCKRIPDQVLENWERRYGVVGASPREMQPFFDQIERDLSVSEIPRDQQNQNNSALRDGVSALGWRGAPMKHNRVGCQQSGFCELGCAYDAKQNALKVVLPAAAESGAKIFTNVEAKKITFAKGRVTGVEAIARGDAGQIVANVFIRARVVALSASATGSSALAISSHILDPFEQLGAGLRIHPGAVVAGLFDREMKSYEGIPQSYECTEHLSFEEGSDKRVWIIPAFAHPIATAATLPGFGAAHMAQMRNYDHLAVLTAMVHDETSGRVSATHDARPKIHYSMSEADRAQLAKGLVACARLLFAAGAREVTIPAIPPIRLKNAGEIASLDLGLLRPHSVPITAVHPMGGMRMGEDPRVSAVKSTGEHHHVRGLFACDGGLFPTSIGGPPQIGIYASALRVAAYIVERARS